MRPCGLRRRCLPELKTRRIINGVDGHSPRQPEDSRVAFENRSPSDWKINPGIEDLFRDTGRRIKELQNRSLNAWEIDCGIGEPFREIDRGIKESHGKIPWDALNSGVEELFRETDRGIENVFRNASCD